ncbi:MAG TPA: diguanylate cyclase [Thermoanaerobaculia bacterium]|nr:diguanylate cyclase [Thermoanaerobaculia bacterium]
MTVRVLLVEHSEVGRAVHARALRGAGFEVEEARDFETAMSALERRPQVVVAAVAVPTMEGFPLLRLLKADPAQARIPVLILSGEGEAASRFWSAKSGAAARLDLEAPAAELAAEVARLAVLGATDAGPATGGPRVDSHLLTRVAGVAARLDAALLQATLAAELLEAGMATGDFHEACRSVLQVLGAVVDARFLGAAAGDAELVAAHVLLPEPLPPELLAELGKRLFASLGLPEGAARDLGVSGERGGEPVDIDLAVWLELPLARGRGSLVLLPRDPGQFATSASSLVDGLVRPLGVVLENALLAERLRELSVLDGLTRLLNRRAIFERLSEEIERARRYRLPLSVVLCDFDYFKRINDRFGHLVGDAVLREGSAVLRKSLRTTDLLGRYGGEEFLAVLPQVDLEAARQAAERLRRDVAAHPLSIATIPQQQITASFGVAALSELGGRTATDELVAIADRRLYEAKAAGRDRVRP